MRHAIREYFSDARGVHQVDNDASLLVKMSPMLRGNVALEASKRWLEQVWFLRGMGEVRTAHVLALDGRGGAAALDAAARRIAAAAVAGGHVAHLVPLLGALLPRRREGGVGQGPAEGLARVDLRALVASRTCPPGTARGSV